MMPSDTVNSSYRWIKLIEVAVFDVLSVGTVEFPFIDNYFLRKKINFFGKFFMIISPKITGRRQE
jgi:hypothetical protein